jgi:hypothetical protein
MEVTYFLTQCIKLSFGLGINCPFFWLGERLQGNGQKHQRHHSGKPERTTSIYCVHFYGPFFGICLSPTYERNPGLGGNRSELSAHLVLRKIAQEVSRKRKKEPGALWARALGDGKS